MGPPQDWGFGSFGCRSALKTGLSPGFNFDFLSQEFLIYYLELVLASSKLIVRHQGAYLVTFCSTRASTCTGVRRLLCAP